MKKLKVYTIGIIASLFIIACSSVETPYGLRLNNGQKWQINSEMKPHIQVGMKVLNEYISSGDKDYVQLSKGLNEQNKKLIKSCTMTGESHDELHKWLLPHMDMIDDLSKANDEKDANLIIAQIEDSFKTFDDYFE